MPGLLRQAAWRSAGASDVAGAGHRGAAVTTGHDDRADQEGIAALLVVNLAGVQRFISQARTTADLWGASTLASRVARSVGAAIEGHGATVIMPVLARDPRPPAADAETAPAVGVTNRILAALNTDSDTEKVVGAVRGAVVEVWRGLLADMFGSASTGQVALAPTRARWVLVERTEGEGYDSLWMRAQVALADRKRVRDFPAYQASGGEACSLCGQRQGVTTLPGRVQRRSGEVLCGFCAVKRDFRRGEGERFPSTASVATAPYRLRVIRRLRAGDDRMRRAVGALHEAHAGLLADLRRLGGTVPTAGRDAIPELGAAAGDDNTAGRVLAIDGSWWLAEGWEPTAVLRAHGLRLRSPEPVVQRCAGGLRNANEVGAALPEGDAAPPASYLAVLVQDADDMGRRLGGASRDASVDRGWHEGVSSRLVEAAAAQIDAVERSGALGRVVYAGGDDLLALLPADGALLAAERARDAFQQTMAAELAGVTASAAVVLFHYASPLQEAIATAHQALTQAKRQPKDQLAVVVLRRGGERARTILPWRDARDRWTTSHLGVVRDAFGGRLSMGLVRAVELEARGLCELERPDDRRGEVTRLVRRHLDGGADPALEEAVWALGVREFGRRRVEELAGWIGALHVARFLAQEGR
jgi:hypothetical protein